MGGKSECGRYGAGAGSFAALAALDAAPSDDVRGGGRRRGRPAGTGELEGASANCEGENAWPPTKTRGTGRAGVSGAGWVGGATMADEGPASVFGGGTGALSTPLATGLGTESAESVRTLRPLRTLLMDSGLATSFLTASFSARMVLSTADLGLPSTAAGGSARVGVGVGTVVGTGAGAGVRAGAGEGTELGAANVATGGGTGDSSIVAGILILASISTSDSLPWSSSTTRTSTGGVTVTWRSSCSTISERFSSLSSACPGPGTSGSGTTACCSPSASSTPSTTMTGSAPADRRGVIASCGPSVEPDEERTLCLD
jgi:hypothetical protein